MKLIQLTGAEIRAALKSRFFIGVLAAAPLLTGLLMGFAFGWSRTPREIPIAVWNQDGQKSSRDFLRFVNSAPAFRIDYQTGDFENGKKLIVSGKVRGFLIIPPDFSRDLKSEKQTSLVFYQDFNFLLPGRTLAKALSKLESWTRMEQTEAYFHKNGVAGKMADFLKDPVRIEYRKLFNPSLEYARYLTPGLLTALLFLSLLITGGASVFFNVHILQDKNRLIIPAVKTLAFLVLSLIPFLIVFGVLFPLFGLDTGNIFILLGYYLLFAPATLWMGMITASLFREPVFATEVIMGLGAISFTISGFTWPRLMFPTAYQWASMAFPLTHYLDECGKIWYETGFAARPAPLALTAAAYGFILVVLYRRPKHV